MYYYLFICYFFLSKQGNGIASPATLDGPGITADEQQRFQTHFHLQLNQLPQQQQSPLPLLPHQQQQAAHQSLEQHNPQFHRPFSDGDFEFVCIIIILLFALLIYLFIL